MAWSGWLPEAPPMKPRPECEHQRDVCNGKHGAGIGSEDPARIVGEGPHRSLLSGTYFFGRKGPVVVEVESVELCGEPRVEQLVRHPEVGVYGQHADNRE